MNILLVLLLCAVLQSSTGQSDVGSTTADPRCERLNDFAVKALARLKKYIPPMYKAEVQRVTGVNIDDPAAVKATLCQIVDVKSLKELAALFNRVPNKQMTDGYREIQHNIIDFGGYTNVERYLSIRKETQEFLSGLNMQPNQTMKDWIDLPTLTHFAEVMQVKFGSRWLSYVVVAKHQGFLITDAAQFAKDAYESESLEDLQERTGLTEDQAQYLYGLARHAQEDPRDSEYEERQIVNNELMIEGLAIVGDIGLLNLEPL